MTKTLISNVRGPSAYQQAVEGGFVGSETEFKAQLANVSGVIVSAVVRNGDLYVTKATGVEINAGRVRGADGANVLPTNQAVAEAIGADGPARVRLAQEIAGGVSIGKQPWAGKKIYLYGDSISSTDYAAYATTLAAKTGATVTRGGYSGASVAALTATSRLDAVANANPDLIIMMTSGNDQGVAGTVGTFVSPALNGETVKGDPDITAPYAGSSFIEAASYIARYLIARRYLYGTKFLYLGGLPQRRNSHSITDPWNNPLNHQRKSNAVREVCERYHIPFLDTLNLCAWDMASEPFWTSPTDKVTVNGVYTMDGLHPSPDGYDRLTDAIAPVINDTLTAKAPTPAVPPQVGGLAVSALSYDRLTLAWTATARTLDYLPQYRVAGASAWTSLAATFGTSVTLTGLSSSTSYELRVIARNPTGSGTASATTTAATTAPATIPAQVTGLTAGAVTSRSVALSWNAISNADSYLVEYRLGTSGTWSTFGTVATNSATVVGLAATSSYQFRVAATNVAGTGSYSSTVTASTVAKVPVADDFQRADNASTMGVTPTGGKAWTPLTADSVFGIASNRGYRVTAAGNSENAVVVDSDTSDIDMSFTVAVRGSGGFGPVFRATDHANYWAVDAQSTGWRLYKRSGGVFTAFAFIPKDGGSAPAAGDVIRVVAVGDSMTISVNGGTQVETIDSFNRDATKHGWRVSGASASAARAGAIAIN